MIQTTKEGRMWKENDDFITPEAIEKLMPLADKINMSKPKTPEHYDNSKGSLYLFSENQELNAWEFDAVKRICRCRKKGQFLEDIDKTIAVLELYKKEYETQG